MKLVDGKPYDKYHFTVKQCELNRWMQQPLSCWSDNASH
jgi:hypothetical protein